MNTSPFCKSGVQSPFTGWGDSASVTVAAPTNTALPVISGTAKQGQILSVSNGSWTGSPTGFSYQWKSAGSNVGTNANTYTIAAGDVGNTITCTVTASNAGGSASATSAATGTVTGEVALRSTAGPTGGGSSVALIAVAYRCVPINSDLPAVTSPKPTPGYEDEIPLPRPKFSSN